MTSTQDGGGITRIDISHRGEVSLASRDIYYQATYLDCQSRVVFTPQKAGGAPGVAVPVTLSLDFTVLLEDDLPGVGTRGISSSRAEIDLEDSRILPHGIRGGGGIRPGCRQRCRCSAAISMAWRLLFPEGDGFRITAQFEVTLDLLPGEEVYLDATSATTLSSEEYLPGVSGRMVGFDTGSNRLHHQQFRFQRCVLSWGGMIPTNRRSSSGNSMSKDGDSTRFQIAWTSIADRTYRLESSPDMQSPWTTVPGREGIASQGSLTTSQVVLNTRNHPHKFYRVVGE